MIRRQRQKGCSHRPQGNVERTNPEYCNVCQNARAKDEAQCLRTRQSCDQALRACHAASAGSGA